MHNSLRLAFTLALTAVAAPALGAPKIMLCVDDGGDGSGADTQAKLKATNAFAVVDFVDCSLDTPTVATMKKYDAVLTWSNGAYSDATTLGDNFTDYMMAGGGVVQMMFNFDGFSGLQGKWSYDCLIPGPMGLLFKASPLKAMPNDPQSPLVQGVTGITATLRSDGTVDKGKGATSVWDFQDGAPGVCKMMVANRPRVDLNWMAVDAQDTKAGDAVRLIKNALLYVAGGFNPIQGMPNPVMFADTGTFAVSAAQTVTYTNTGMAPLTVTAVAVSGMNAADFTITRGPGLPLAVAPNATFTVDVAFSPQVAGARSAALSATVGGQMNTADVSLVGNAVPSSLQVTPNPLAFNGTPLNTPVNKMVSVTNKGMGKVTVTMITASGAPFTVSGLPNLPVSLNAGGAFTFTATFNPAMNGTFMGSVVIASNDPNTPMIKVPATGCAGPSAVSLDVGTLSFGAVNLGATQTDTVMVTNTGCADLKVSDVQLGGANAGDFAIDKAALIAAPLVANAAKTFSVTFKPMAMGMRAATATVVSGVGNKVVALQGQGTTATVKVAPMAVAFGSQAVGVASMPMNVTVSDMGTGSLKVMAVTLGGPDAGSFSSPGPAAPFTIGPNLSMPVGLVCTPVKIGALTATLTLTTDVGNAVVNLTCTGVAPMIAVKPNKLDFGSVFVAVASMPQAVTITNNGTAPLNLMSVSFGTGTDFSSPDMANLPMALAPKGTASFHVVFTPSMHGMEMDEVDIASDDPKMGMLAIPLTGNGVQAGISTDPTDPMAVDFGMVPTDTTATHPLLITNTGDVDVSISSVTVSGEGFATDAKGGIMIPVGGMTSVNLQFTPPSGGMKSGTVTVTPGGGLMPAVVMLQGVGIAPSIALDQMLLDFGPVQVGSSSAPRPVVIRNTGTTPLQLGAVASNQPQFAVDSSMLLPMLAPGASTTFAVTFTPTATMPTSGSIGVTLKGKTKPSVTLAATGTGTPPRPPKGCACALGARTDRGSGGLLALALLGVAALARRRRRAA